MERERKKRKERRKKKKERKKERGRERERERERYRQSAPKPRWQALFCRLSPGFLRAVARLAPPPDG